MHNFLVEEHTSDPYGTERGHVPFRVLVHADDMHQAFIAAALNAYRTRGKGFLFSSSELEEVEPGYLYVAADGSSIWYEIRDLGINLPETDFETEKKWRKSL